VAYITLDTQWLYAVFLYTLWTIKRWQKHFVIITLENLYGSQCIGGEKPKSDLHKILHWGDPGRNHRCKFWGRSVKPFLSGDGSNFRLFYRLSSWSGDLQVVMTMTNNWKKSVPCKSSILSQGLPPPSRVFFTSVIWSVSLSVKKLRINFHKISTGQEKID